MFENFIQYLRFEKRFSEHTVIAYENDLKQFASFLELQIESDAYTISASTVRSWIVEMIDKGLTNKSVNRKLASLRTYYRWLRKEAIIEVSPMQKIQGPKNEKRLPVFAKESELTTEKLEDVFADTFEGLRDELMFELFYQTGIRLSELVELKETDVSEQHIKVLGKRNKERIIPISIELKNKINIYLTQKHKGLGASKYLLVLKNGNKLYSTLVYRKINYYLGLTTSLDKKSPHILRHTFATHMLNRGSGLETLKDLLGHANLSATQVYTHNSFAKLTAIYSQAHPRGRNK
jgi:integrase/recombinase XerC